MSSKRKELKTRANEGEGTWICTSNRNFLNLRLAELSRHAFINMPLPTYRGLSHFDSGGIWVTQGCGQHSLPKGITGEWGSIDKRLWGLPIQILKKLWHNKKGRNINQRISLLATFTIELINSHPQITLFQEQKTCLITNIYIHTYTIGYVIFHYMQQRPGCLWYKAIGIDIGFVLELHLS